MLACIACSKGEDDKVGGPKSSARAAAAAPAGNKDAVKSLTLQIKDMVLKISGAYRQCKGGGGSDGSYPHKGHHGQFDGASESQYTYLRAASSSSLPAWDFSNFGGGTAYTKEAEDVVVLEDEGNEEPKEWMAQVEPGVHITFVSIPGSNGNDLKRIRFSREMFNKSQAQRWWGENYDRIMELYNVQKFSRQALDTPLRSEDGNQRESFCSRVGSCTLESPAPTPSTYRNTGAVRRASTLTCSSVPDPSEHMMMDASRMTTSSNASMISMSNASCDQEIREWVEQDEPGVFITIRQLADGGRELRRVRFSREMFGEVHAKLWWEENRERIQSQYL